MPTARKFSVVLLPEDNDTYTVFVPALPEVNAMGATRDEAYANAEDPTRQTVVPVHASKELGRGATRQDTHRSRPYD